MSGLARQTTASGQTPLTTGGRYRMSIRDWRENTTGLEKTAEGRRGRA